MAKIFSCSINPHLLRRIDDLKEDVPRSRFIARLIETSLNETNPKYMKSKKKIIPLDNSFDAKDQEVSVAKGEHEE